MQGQIQITCAESAFIKDTLPIAGEYENDWKMLDILILSRSNMQYLK